MLFQGGPYDGRDLPIQPPFAKVMRLPGEKDLAAFLGARPRKSLPILTIGLRVA